MPQTKEGVINYLTEKLAQAIQVKTPDEMSSDIKEAIGDIAGADFVRNFELALRNGNNNN